jgi:hypothetical protein
VGDAQDLPIPPQQMAAWLSVVRQKLASRTHHQTLEAGEQQQQQQQEEGANQQVHEPLLQRGCWLGLAASDLVSLLTSLSHELLEFPHPSELSLRPHYLEGRHQGQRNGTSTQDAVGVAAELQGVMHQVVDVLMGAGGRTVLEAATLYQLSRVMCSVPLLVHVSQAGSSAHGEVEDTAAARAHHIAQWLAETCKLVVQRLVEKQVSKQGSDGHQLPSASSPAQGHTSGRAGDEDGYDFDAWYPLLEAIESAAWLPAGRGTDTYLLEQVHALLDR